jgi:hypothetical protein
MRKYECTAAPLNWSEITPEFNRSGATERGQFHHLSTGTPTSHAKLDEIVAHLKLETGLCLRKTRATRHGLRVSDQRINL